MHIPLAEASLLLVPNYVVAALDLACIECDKYCDCHACSEEPAWPGSGVVETMTATATASG